METPISIPGVNTLLLISTKRVITIDLPRLIPAAHFLQMADDMIQFCAIHGVYIFLQWELYGDGLKMKFYNIV